MRVVKVDGSWFDSLTMSVGWELTLSVGEVPEGRCHPLPLLPISPILTFRHQGGRDLFRASLASFKKSERKEEPQCGSSFYAVVGRIGAGA